MRYPIVRMYETEKQARNAVSKLKEEGFSEDTIFLVTPSSGRGATSSQALSTALMAGFMLRGDAQAHAEAVKQGRSLVLMLPPFGQGQLAQGILDDYGPIKTVVERPAADGVPVAWDEAMPLSSALKLRVLLRNRPAPFSALLGMSTLSQGRSFGSRRELTSPHFTASSLLGLGLLSRRPAPLSSLFGLKTIAVRKGSRQTSLGLPLLSSNPAPLSSKLGLHLLVGRMRPSEPAPFSAHLGLPTLTRRQKSPMPGRLLSSRFALFGHGPLIRNAAPLSSLFGLSTLSGKGGPSWTASFGMPLLAQGGKPISSKLRLPTLSRNPAPLSSLFGLPVLSRYQ